MKSIVTKLSLVALITLYGFSSSLGVGSNLHGLFDTLLKKHVSANGNVNYNAFKSDAATLSKYIKLLQENQPSNSWTKNDKLAYWINVYNANTISLMLKNWPISSIKDIKKDGKGPWDIPFILAEGKVYSLNNIENDIIRKRFNEPRIHFAVNCAAKGCPPLMNSAFIGSKLNSQLQTQTIKFINNPYRNKITASSVQLSKIFEWYIADFTKNGSLIGFINTYAKTKANSNASVGYLDYNWEVNK